MSDFRFRRSVGAAASAEAMASPLPGCLDGPADAYRHIVGTAELRRRFGFAIAYGNAGAPDHAAWRARVRQYFEERTPPGDTREGVGAEAKPCSGVASVRAYTRAGPSGPVQVGAHSRTVTCG